jgi:nucleoside-diphosphate-sugar epimerase
MHLILTGATGMVGTAVLDRMLKAKDVTRISILSRRPVRFADEVKDPRVNVIIHTDFTKYDTSTLQEQLKDAKGCVWALGSTSTTQTTPEEYRKATRDYGVEAAKAFAKMGTEDEPFRFVYISGEGATQTPGMTTTLYARVKGEAEEMLTKVAEETPSLMVLSARIGGVDAAGHEAMAKYGPERIFMHRVLGTTLMPALKALYGKMHMPTITLGDVCTQLVSLHLHASR